MFRDTNPPPNPTARHNGISVAEIPFEPEHSLWSAGLEADMRIATRSIAICEEAARQASAALRRVIERLDEEHPLEAEVRQATRDLRNDLNDMLAARLNQESK